MAELTQAIGEMYRSDEYKALMSLNNQMTFMHMLKIDRDEETHSAFLSHVFRTIPSQQVNSFENNPVESPVLLLMRLLAMKAQQQVESCDSINKMTLSDLMEKKLWSNLMTNECSVSVSKVKTEDYNQTDSQKGRADIVIDSYVKYHDGSEPFKVRIIIENKIDSKEGQGQCKRYYDYYDNNHNSKVMARDGVKENVFVFLAPHSPESTSDKHFIKIDYSDLLRYVFRPMLNNRSAYSENILQAIEIYIKTITSLRNNQIAMDEEYITLVKRFFAKNEQLIEQVIEVVAGESTKKKFREAKATRTKYRVEYKHNGTLYEYPVEDTPLSKVALQVAYVLARAGWTANDIEAEFGGLFKNGKFLNDQYIDKAEEIEIGGKKYWIKNNVWTETSNTSNYAKRLFEKISDIEGLSYTKI